MNGEPIFSALDSGFISTMRVTKSALTLSSEVVEIKYRRQVQGEILDVDMMMIEGRRKQFLPCLFIFDA